MCEVDSNEILVEPMKTKTEKEMISTNRPCSTDWRNLVSRQRYISSIIRYQISTNKKKQEQNTIWIYAMRNALQKFIIERDINFQRKLQFITMWSGRLVTTKPVGQNHPTNRNWSETTMAGKRDIKKIIVYVPQRTTWFQSYDNGTIGLRRPNPLKPWPQSIVGTPLHEWVVPGDFHLALSLLQCMDQRNRVQKSTRHSLLQEKIHNKPNSDTLICSCIGSETTHRGTQSKFYDRYGWNWNIPTQKIGCNLQHNRQ